MEKISTDELNQKSPQSSASAGTRATSLVSMTKENKEHLTETAKKHGLSLSAFFRLAAEEYIENHKW